MRSKNSPVRCVGNSVKRPRDCRCGRELLPQPRQSPIICWRAVEEHKPVALAVVFSTTAYKEILSKFGGSLADCVPQT
jgi:hypothetical protein